MGIRIALGADPRIVRGLVLRQGSVLVIAGIVCGLAVAAAVTRTLSTFFVLVGALDAPTFVVVTVMLAAIALVACYIPARRAMRVDPMVALRHEWAFCPSGDRLLRPAAAARAGIRRRRHRDARARDRRQHRHLQHPERLPASAPSPARRPDRRPGGRDAGG
jgi:hypothetical protein